MRFSVRGRTEPASGGERLLLAGREAAVANQRGAAVAGPVQGDADNGAGGSMSVPTMAAERGSAANRPGAVRSAPKVTVASRVVLPARVDGSTAEAVRRALHDAVDHHDGDSGDVGVDLSQVVQIDVVGLGILMGTHDRAQRRGLGLVLVDVPHSVKRVLAFTRLDRVLRPTAAAWLRAARRDPG